MDKATVPPVRLVTGRARISGHRGNRLKSAGRKRRQISALWVVYTGRTNTHCSPEWAASKPTHTLVLHQLPIPAASYSRVTVQHKAAGISALLVLTKRFIHFNASGYRIGYFYER